MMKKTLVNFAILLIVSAATFAQTLKDTVYSRDVRSIVLQRESVDLSQPILRLGSGDRLLLQFDVLGEESRYYSYRIQHCSHDWQVDDLAVSEYLNGFETSSIGNSRNSFTTRQPYVHYWETIPNEMTTFNASGNYLLTVYSDDDPDSVLFTRRFYVYEVQANIKSEIGQVLGSEGKDHNQNVSVYIEPPKGQYFNNPTLYYHLYVRQNGRADLCRELPLHSVKGNELHYKWKDENVFPGGNVFRYFDISNINIPMYTTARIEVFGDDYVAYLKPEEDRSRKNYVHREGLHGQYKISAENRNDATVEADYVWVNFALPMATPRMDGTFHIVGDFVGWDFSDENMMQWQPQMKAYTMRAQVKQGYYSYQIVFVKVGQKEGLTSVVEGDFFEAKNEYYIFLYQHTPADRYDRLIGATVVKN
ncbi:MAG: DUF5103 domain-containing protein [Bacteroidales bacterium]|nr:DUF5103 domain-containing protein [Bacteroidales bacterium]